MVKKKLNILVVDDSIERHLIFKNKFPDDSIVSATYYRQAIAYLIADNFDVVCLDHDLGDEFDGMDIIDHIVLNKGLYRSVLFVVHTFNAPAGKKMCECLKDAGLYHTRLHGFLKNDFIDLRDIIDIFKAGYFKSSFVVNKIKER
jgi:CheY-like chemotaxis protein